MNQVENNNFDGFSVKAFRDEDGDWLAHFIELPNVSAFADTRHAALDELEIAWMGVKESYRKHGEEIPTKLSQPRFKIYISKSCLKELRYSLDKPRLHRKHKSKVER